MNIRQKQLVIKEEQYRTVDAKLTRAEEKFMDDAINKDTYKKWERKYMGERSRLKEEINYLKSDIDGAVDKKWALLSQLLDLKELFNYATINQQHSILNKAFKQGLTFREQAFRRPSINPAFSHNTLKMKEKGLLFIEQPLDISDGLPLSGEGGSPLQHLKGILDVVREIVLNNEGLQMLLKSNDNQSLNKKSNYPSLKRASTSTQNKKKRTKGKKL